MAGSTYTRTGHVPPPPEIRVLTSETNGWYARAWLTSHDWNTEARPQNVAFWGLNVREAISVFSRLHHDLWRENVSKKSIQIFSILATRGRLHPFWRKNFQKSADQILVNKHFEIHPPLLIASKPQPPSTCMIRELRSVFVRAAITSIWPKLAH